MSEWQLIETAPKDETPVLVWDGEYITVAHCSVHHGKAYWSVHESYGFNEDGGIPNPTHWMPLPEPPGSSHPLTPGAKREISV